MILRGWRMVFGRADPKAGRGPVSGFLCSTIRN